MIFPKRNLRKYLFWFWESSFSISVSLINIYLFILLKKIIFVGPMREKVNTLKGIGLQGDLRGAFNKFLDFFVQAFKIVVDTMLLLCILWDDWPIFMISGSNEQLQQELEYTLLKPDCHSWWILKMQSGREDTLEERYAIKFCFKLGIKCHRNVWNASDCFWSILHESSISFWVA